MGWPGTYVDPGRQSSLMDQLKEHRLVPIFLVSVVVGFAFYWWALARLGGEKREGGGGGGGVALTLRERFFSRQGRKRFSGWDGVGWGGVPPARPG